MELHTSGYEPRYKYRCVRLIGETWDLQRILPEATNPRVIEELFFREATLDANHAELIVDEAGEVHGFLFGIIKRAPRGGVRAALRATGAVLWALGRFLGGGLGPRRRALATIRKLLSMLSSLDALRKDDDAYVSLFIVRSPLRGKGWGKRLLDDYRAKAAGYGAKRLYLWTDKSCNYGFYDRMGFERIKEIESPFLAAYGSGPNGFVYALPVGDGTVVA
jgi:ribosomal protein S18 acetylase RimI-like enzyme